MGTMSIGWAALTATLMAASVAHAGDPLSSLQDRGRLSASDQLPILPAGAPRLQSTTAGAILGFVRNYPAGIWCDGAHDDTAAIQAAINAGGSFDLPPGVCVTSATLTLSTVSSHGQVIRGAGATAGDGSGQGKTTIRPTSVVSTAVRLDGSPFNGYLQGAAIEALTLDMSAMAAGSNGFQQLQAYDIRYGQIRVMGDSGKTSWLFGPGAYTTSLNDIQGALVYCLGNGVNNPTTITLVNPDINGLNVEQCANVTTIGGAVQPGWRPEDTIIFVPPGSSGLYGFGEIPVTGVYLALGSYALNAQYLTSLGTDWESLLSPPITCALAGWNFGTYNDGSHGCAPMLLAVRIDASVNGANFSNSTFSGLYAYAPGVADISLGGYQSGANSPASYKGGNQVFSGSLNIVNAQPIRFYSDFSMISQTGILDGSTGSLLLSGGVTANSFVSNGGITGQSLGIIATSNNNFVNLLDSASHPVFGCYSGGTRLSDSCYSGSIIGYQDDSGTKPAWSLNSNTGSISAGSELCPGAGSPSSPTLTSAGCLLSGNGNPAASLGINGDFYLRGDCTHGSSNCFWHKEAGAWIDIS